MAAFSTKEALRYGWETTKLRWVLLLSVLLTAILLPNIFNSFFSNSNLGVRAVISLVVGLLSMYLSLGQTKVFIDVVDKKSPTFADMFKQSSFFVQFVVGEIIAGVLTGLAFVFFIIPGIIVALRLQFVPYLIADKGLGPIQAIHESWRITTGNTGALFLYGLATIGLFLLGLLALGVGILIVLPTVAISTTYIYRQLSTRS